MDRPLQRVAAAVLVVSLVYVLGFMLAAGFTLVLAGELVLLYFLSVLAISRVRSEAGFAWAYGPSRFSASLSHIVTDLHGTANLPPRNLALLSLFHWLWWDLRFALMPAQMDALKIGDGAGIRRRQLLALMAGALVVAVVVGLPWVLHDSYRFGWGTAKTYIGPATGARQAYNLGVGWMTNATYPNGAKMGGMAFGAAFTFFLGVMRQRFVWWPFHPIGYVMSSTATGIAFWFYYLLAWTIKGAVLRWGGMRLYRQSLPLVIGVILGDVASQTLWSIGASLLDVPVYQFVS